MTSDITIKLPERKLSYEELSSELQMAMDWLGEFGIKLNASRFGQYQKCLEEIQHYFDLKDKDILLRDYTEKLRVISLEIFELLDIYDGISNFDIPGLHDKLNKYIKGPFDHQDENPVSNSNLSRNIAFELQIISLLLKKNFNLDFKTNADAELIMDDYITFIECKRLFSESQANKNIEKAHKQIIKRYETATNSNIKKRGVIALSLTKILNPETKVLFFRSTAETNTHVSELVDNFMLKYDMKWASTLAKSNIFGFLTYFACPIFIENEGMKERYHHTDLISFCKPDSEDEITFAKIFKPIA